MSYDFSKLSRVPPAQEINDNTLSLVINSDSVESTNFRASVHTRDNYTSECVDYITQHSGDTPSPTPITYIRTLSPLQPDNGDPNEYIRTGYIIYNNVYYLFDVYGDTNHSYYDITATDFSTDDVERYLYDSSDLITQYNYEDIVKHFIIEASGTTASQDIICNKTWDEVKTAITNGFNIVLNYKLSGSSLRETYSSWVIDQSSVYYESGVITGVTFSGMLTTSTASVYKSLYFNMSSNTPTIVITDEDIASIRSSKMDKASPSGTGMLTLNGSSEGTYKFLKVNNVGMHNGGFELVFDEVSDRITVIKTGYMQSRPFYLYGIGALTPTNSYDIVPKSYADNIITSKVDNTDGVCNNSLTINSTEEYPSLWFGSSEENDGISIGISRDGETLSITGDNNDEHTHFYPTISGVGDPTSDYYVANKRYVDNGLSNKINCVNGSGTGTLSISNITTTPPSIRFNNDARPAIGVHSLYIDIKRDFDSSVSVDGTTKRNRSLYFDGNDNGTSFKPILENVGNPVEKYDVSNKTYVDMSESVFSLPNNKTIDLSNRNRQRVTVYGQIKELAFLNFTSSSPEECWVIFKTDSTAYSTNLNFKLTATTGIVYPSNINLSARDCFKLNKTYMIHFVRAKDTTDAWKTFAEITEYSI